MRHLLVVVLVSAACISGCTSAQQRQLAKAASPPSVDLRAVTNGVEVGFVCGPGRPTFSDLGLVNSANRVTQHITHMDYPALHTRATQSIVIPIPAADRNKRVNVAVGLASGRTHGFPIYVATFTYDSLPRTRSMRIEGALC